MPGKEGEIIFISLYQQQDTSQKLLQLQASLETEDPQLEFPGIWAPRGPVPAFQIMGACILMILLLQGLDISALIGQKSNLLIQCLGFILATPSEAKCVFQNTASCRNSPRFWSGMCEIVN